MTAPDPILDAIDNAVRDYEISDDAMRWTPEPSSEPTAAPLIPVPRIEEIEIRVKTSDGMEHTYAMAGAENVMVSTDWERADPDPWDMFRLTAPTRMESFTLEVEYPIDFRHTLRDRGGEATS